MLRALLHHCAVSWVLVQYAAGSFLGGTGSGWYPPVTPPFIPQPTPSFIPQPPPVVENPLCLGNNVNSLFPFLPNVGGIFVVAGQVCGRQNFGPNYSGSVVDEITEMVDEKVMIESAEQVLSNNYNPYGPAPPYPYPYYPPRPQPVYPPYYASSNFGYRTGASRTLGDE